MLSHPPTMPLEDTKTDQDHIQIRNSNSVNKIGGGLAPQEGRKLMRILNIKESSVNKPSA